MLWLVPSEQHAVFQYIPRHFIAAYPTLQPPSKIPKKERLAQRLATGWPAFNVVRERSIQMLLIAWPLQYQKNLTDLTAGPLQYSKQSKSRTPAPCKHCSSKYTPDPAMPTISSLTTTGGLSLPILLLIRHVQPNGSLPTSRRGLHEGQKPRP